MKSPKLSETTIGRTIALISKAMVTATTSELLLVSTPDGGNCSDIKMDLLLMIKERFLMSTVELMLKTETLLFMPNMERSIKDGKSSMLMNIQTSQQRDNSTKSSVFTLREISILYHSSHHIDTLI
jgi:hypothetical protein